MVRLVDFNPGGEIAHVKNGGFTIFVYIEREWWAKLSKNERWAVALHEYRHIMQAWYAPLSVVCFLWGSYLLPPWVTLGLSARMAYIAFRAWGNVSYSEFDANRFAYRLYPRGTVSLLKRTGVIDEPDEEDKRSSDWFRKKWVK